MIKMIPNTITGIFAGMILYTFFCLYQAMNMPIDMVFMSAKVIDTEGRTERPLGTTVKRGERVVVKFRIPARNVSGWNYVERRLIDASNAEVVVSKTDRRWKAHTTFEVEGQFPIPLTAATGCGAVIFSKSFYTIKWNMLTKVAPLAGSSPPITFCIE